MCVCLYGCEGIWDLCVLCVRACEFLQSGMHAESTTCTSMHACTQTHTNTYTHIHSCVTLLSLLSLQACLCMWCHLHACLIEQMRSYASSCSNVCARAGAIWDLEGCHKRGPPWRISVRTSWKPCEFSLHHYINTHTTKCVFVKGYWRRSVSTWHLFESGNVLTGQICVRDSN